MGGHADDDQPKVSFGGVLAALEGEHSGGVVASGPASSGPECSAMVAMGFATDVRRVGF